jgi:hypothetical protein
MASTIRICIVLLALVATATSCTKEETTIVEYEPITIEGQWHLTAWYDVSLQTIQNYPAVLDSTIVTFSDTGKVFIKSSCTGGNGYYLQTQTKEMLVYDLFYPGIFCGTLENETQGIIFDAMELAYSFDLVDDKLTIRSDKTATPFLYLRKL